MPIQILPLLAALAAATSPPRQEEPADDSTAILTGTVVASDGSPVEGAHVQVSRIAFWSLDYEEQWIAAWTERLGSPPEVHRVSTRADATGRFRLEIEISESEARQLVIRAAPTLTREVITLGIGNAKAHHRLEQGPQDLGLFTLEPATEIHGVVTDQFAVPLDEAWVSVSSELDESLFGIASFTDARGHYRIPHLTAGPLELGVATDLALFEDVPRTVQIERSLEPLELNLVVERAPRVSGHCVDEDGAPIPGVQVGVPGTYGIQRMPALTDEAGQFAGVQPREPGPFTVAVWKDGYIPIGEPVGGRSFESDSPDTVFVLRKVPPQTTFQVLDIDTQEPIEHFHIKRLYGQGQYKQPQWLVPRDIIGIGGGGGGKFGGRFGGRRNMDPKAIRPVIVPLPLLIGPGGEPEARPEGTAELPARMSLDRVRVSTPGYLPVESEIVHVDRHTPSQTIHLSRGATVRGRWMRGTRPEAGIRIRVEPGVMEPVSDEPDAPRRFKANHHRWLETTTWIDGTFEIPGLDNGVHRIRAWPRDLAHVSFRTFTVEDHADVDLGDREVTH